MPRHGLMLAALMVACASEESDKNSDTDTIECVTSCSVDSKFLRTAADVESVADCDCIDGNVFVAPEAGVSIELPELLRVFGKLEVQSPFEGDSSGMTGLISVTELALTGETGRLGAVLELPALETLGTVSIEGGHISDVRLPSLRTAEAIVVEEAPGLRSLVLSGLTRADRLVVQNTQALTSIELGVSSLIEDVTLENNAALAELTGTLDFEGELRVVGQQALPSLAWLDGVTSLTVGSVVIEQNAALKSVGLMASTTRLRGRVTIADNPSLVTFESLPQLEEISADIEGASGLDVTGNDVLSVMELPSLVRVEGGVTILSNPCLDQAEMAAWAESLSADGVLVQANGAGCP